MFNFLRAAVNAMRAARGETLPAVSASLEEVTRASEASTQRALEQAELLQGHLGRLAETLSTLERHVALDAESRAAWSESVEACLAMAPAVTAVVRAMGFREPAGEQLQGVAGSLQTMRLRFDEVLALLDAPRQTGYS